MTRTMYEFKPEDAERFARHVNIRTKRKADELMFLKCPYCNPQTDDKYTFSINLTTGLFKCFRASCEAKGNMITLAKDFDFPIDFGDGEKFYERKKEYKRLGNVKPISKPKAIEYLASRGISEQVARDYNITVHNKWENVLVFPFYDENGDLIFVKYRKTDFDKAKDKNKEWCEPNCKPILFGMNHCNFENKTLIVTEGQCFDGKAEILTSSGWVRFEDYAGQEVLQVNDALEGSFVRPARFIVKRYQGNMVHVSIGGNYETYTTDDHNLVFEMPNGKLIKKQAGEKISTAYHIPTAVSVNSNKMSLWTRDMFALYIAISADGTIDYRKGTGWRKPKNERYVRIAIPLERKHKRIMAILNSLGIEYTNNKQKNGYWGVCFSCPDWLKSKYLPYEFATETSIEQKREIIEEIVEWDGNRVKNRNQYEFTSIIKHNADVIQLIASTCGYMSTIMSKECGGNGEFKKSYCYKVSILKGKKNVSTQQFEKHKKLVPVDQRVYCVSVDTGMILVRQNGKISVTGNCDSLSLSEAGIENAVSVPTGAKGFTWVPHCWNFLKQFKTLIVFGDCEKGHITLLDELSQRFEGVVKHIRFQDYLECKDANEILQKFGKQALVTAVNNAVVVAHPQIKVLADVKRVDLGKLEKFSTGLPSLDGLIGGFFFGQLILLTGERGEGKSTLASQFGTFAIKAGYNAFFYSGELINWFFKAWFESQVAGINHMNKKITDSGFVTYSVDGSVEGDMEKWYRDKAFVFDSGVLTDANIRLTDVIRTAIQQYGCRFVVVDNLMSAMVDVDANEQYSQQTKFVNELSKMAKQFNVVVMLVAHPRKKMTEDFDNDDVAGSSNVTNLVDVVMRYSRPTGKEIPKDTDQRILTVLKNRLTGKTNRKGIELFYEQGSRRISEDSTKFDWTLGWESDREQQGFREAEKGTVPPWMMEGNG